jgi:hypothetical protein
LKRRPDAELATDEEPTGRREEMEARAVCLLHDDPNMRQAFINRVAAPIANKLFECGMTP